MLCIYIIKVQAFGEETKDIRDDSEFLWRYIPPFQTLLKKVLPCPAERELAEKVSHGVGVVTLHFCILSTPGTGCWSRFWTRGEGEGKVSLGTTLRP